MTCLVPYTNSLRTLSYLVSESAKRILKSLKQGFEPSETLVFQPKKSSLKSSVSILKRSFFILKQKPWMDSHPPMALKRWVSRQETTIRADVILYNTAIAAFEKMSNWQAGIFKGEKCLAFNERCTGRCFFW